MAYDIYPLQYFGLGDIIYTQTLVRNIAGDQKIIWGVLPELLDGLKIAYPDIYWCDYKTLDIDYECRVNKIVDNKFILPIRWSAEICNTTYDHVMQTKYIMYGQDPASWMNKVKWHYNQIQEISLLKYLHINKGDDFIVINPHFSAGIINIPIHNNFTIIEMRTIPAYSLFDWRLVLIWAKEIHTVSTSLFFILKALNLMDKTTLYPRRPYETNLKNIQDLL